MIELEQVGRKDASTGRWLIRDVTATVRPGDRVVLFGPSGAGKSVLLRLIGMLDPCTSGQIRWQHAGIADEDVPRYRRQVVYLPQRPSFLGPTVADSLAMPFRLATSRGATYSQPHALELLGALGRDAEFLNQKTAELSGGEGQIVALVRGLQLEPRVLLLDEPTASVDAATSAAIASLVHQWFTADPTRAMIWITHHDAEARSWANRQWNMRGGRLSPENPPSKS